MCGSSFSRKDLLLLFSFLHNDGRVVRVVPPVDPVGPEVVDQVLHHVHHVGGHVVEGDRVVAQPTETLVLEKLNLPQM